MDSSEVTIGPISLFYSYSHRDETLRQELEAHLSFLKRGNLIAEWHDRKIDGGGEWKAQIDHYIGTADIVLLLVSADFIASDYCWGEEMTKALARHERGEARVIPVILRPCRWMSTRLGKLQAVPKDAKAVSEWSNRDAAFDDIATAVERTVQELRQFRQTEKVLRTFKAFRNRQQRHVEHTPEAAAISDGWDGWTPRFETAPAELPAGTVFRDGDDCPEMVVVPAGEFMMGEGTQHKVTIARPFAVGKYPVTFDEWDACVAAGGCKYKPEDAGWGRSRRPAINVSWDDAQEYVAWLSKKTGKSYRLLSEAEWEYAARAGTTTRYPWGDEPGTNLANFQNSGSQWSGKQTSPVGSFEPNAFGLYDMIGNVWEWLQDCWNDSYKGAPTDGSAWESGNCGLRVVLGGSCCNLPELARVAIRSRLAPSFRLSFQGFRLARTL